jgi:hypothetical protein
MTALPALVCLKRRHCDAHPTLPVGPGPCSARLRRRVDRNTTFPRPESDAAPDTLRGLATRRYQTLAEELKLVIRKAAHDPEGLEGELPTLSDFASVVSRSFQHDGEQVYYIVRELIPAYLGRLPDGPDCNAIRELFEYEDEQGERQSLTDRYHKASAHIVNEAIDFARRQEPRLLKECALAFLRFDLADSIDAGKGVRDVDTPVLDADLGPFAQVLWTQTVEEHKLRLAEIQEGLVTLRRPEEILDLVLTMTEAAKHTLHAIDQTALENWSKDWRLRRYLETQLARARDGEVTVERLRVVRQSELDQPGQVDLLRKFITMHDAAGATLLVCHEDDLRTLHVSFVSDSPSATVDRIIMLTIDVDSQPASLVSRLEKEGRYVKEGTLHLRSLAQIRKYHTDLERVKKHLANRANAGEDLRTMLGTDPRPLPE